MSDRGALQPPASDLRPAFPYLPRRVGPTARVQHAEVDSAHRARARRVGSTSACWSTRPRPTRRSTSRDLVAGLPLGPQSSLWCVGPTARVQHTRAGSLLLPGARAPDGRRAASPISGRLAPSATCDRHGLPWARAPDGRRAASPISSRRPTRRRGAGPPELDPRSARRRTRGRHRPVGRSRYG